MAYPSTIEIFPLQTPDTIADSDFINDITNLLVALENQVGYTTDGPATPTHEGRLKRLEGSSISRTFFGSTTPTGTPLVNDIWINTGVTPWVEYYYTGTAWVILGANGIMLSGKMFDVTITPTDSQVPVYRSVPNRIQWESVLANPLHNPGELIIGGVGGTPTILPAGDDDTVLIIDPTTHLPIWGDVPEIFDTPHINEYLDFELAGAPALSNTGELRLYASASPLRLYYSANGGSYIPIGSGGDGDLSTLLNTQGAMVYASDNLGTLAKLSLGSEGSVLASIGGIPTWLIGAYIASPAGSIVGSILFYDGISWVQLSPGTSGQFLKTRGFTDYPEWVDLPSSPPGSGITSPAGSTTGDVLVHNGTDWVRLPAGTAGFFLQTHGTSGIPTWVAVSGGGGFTSPMTDIGDTIYGSIAGAPVRLAGGVANNDKFMTIIAGIPAWTDNPASMGKSMWVNG